MCVYVYGHVKTSTFQVKVKVKDLNVS